jgi:uncharacterized protein YcaQ
VAQAAGRPVTTLTAAQARRIAIAAQGLARPRTRPAVADRRHLRGVLRRTGLLQIDSVNVLARAHYLPAFSRLGGYPTAVLDLMAYRDRELFEYWGHEAALLPVDLHPLMRWRMAHYESRLGRWGRITALTGRRPGYVEQVLAELTDRGPSSAGEIAAGERRGTDNWGWNWTDAKTALEWLFMIGRVSVAARPRFERVYDLTERVIPAHVLAAPTPDPLDAQRELVARAAACQGVGTVADLADHFRQKPTVITPLVRDLVDDGRLLPVTVRGWERPAYLHPDAAMPRWATGRALLVPFDPLVWTRERVERMWGMRYRIEIYVPAPKRVHGYYVLPFLLGDALVARVDLKADRQAGRLLVQAAHAEPDAPPETAAALADELRELATWLRLGPVEVAGPGELAPALAAALAVVRP